MYMYSSYWCILGISNRHFEFCLRLSQRCLVAQPWSVVRCIISSHASRPPTNTNKDGDFVIFICSLIPSWPYTYLLRDEVTRMHTHAHTHTHMHAHTHTHTHTIHSGVGIWSATRDCGYVWAPWGTLIPNITASSSSPSMSHNMLTRECKTSVLIE